MSPQDWVRIDALLAEGDARALRDLIHQEGFPARVEHERGCGWRVLVRHEHVAIAESIYERHFGAPPPRRRVTLFRRKPAA